MKSTISVLFAALLATGPGAAQAATSGIDREFIDPAVSARQDFFQHVNGGWLKATPMPADRASVGAFEQIHESIQTQLRGLIEDAAARGAQGGGDAEARKIGDLFASFMDEARVEQLGATPLAADMAAIDALADTKQLTAYFARALRAGVRGPLAIGIGVDDKDSTRYVAFASQSGLGLPDRDYFLEADNARFKEVRAQYQLYVGKLLALTGTADGAALAPAVLALEAEIAKLQWSGVENRDPQKTYNPMPLAELRQRAPNVDWDGVFAALGLQGKTDFLVVAQPSYLAGLSALLANTPLATWKAYLKVRYANAFAGYLSKDFVDARFAFRTAITGTPQNLPRWKRGVALVEESVGEGLGQLYVAKYFPPENKRRMEQLVANLLAAFKVSVAKLDWMGPATKKQAQAKLATFVPKIGYPKRWIDYGTLEIRRDDLLGNVRRAREFDYARDVAKLGKPIDRDEWGLSPQTVNAYYNPSLNEVVFPAAILQPPFFDAQADDAVNYGGIGAVIGHEISHGFDDQGSQYDAQGNLRDWWTAADRARFTAKAKGLVAQYGAYEPVPGFKVNGELTLGENIADNSGLAIAYKAYKLSLKGRPAPVIDGLTGDQRFFLGFGQVWRGKTRDEALIAQLKADPHSPNEIRANGTVRNHPGFYSTFGVKPGDPMYLPPGKRVSIW
ncbi:MAG: M13 family metallopeptidase [Bacteroidia bacterium]